MQKTSSALLGALVLLVTGLVIWKAGPQRPDSVVVPNFKSSNNPVSSSSPESSATKTSVDIINDPSFRGIKGLKPGFALLDGSRPPPVPDEAPDRVKFGVILVQYRGAQRASMATRSKARALQLAKSLAQLAKTDFKAAVQQGDAGSTERAGWMPAGVLEPAPNYVLLMTAPGEIGGPVDTPTGYWIVKNISKPNVLKKPNR